MFCKQCGKEVKDNWKICPYCKYVLKKPSNSIKKRKRRNKKLIYKKWWFWIIVVVCLISYTIGKKSNTSKEIRDCSELIGLKENELSEYGFEKNENDELKYEALEGAVEVGCDDEKVVEIMLLPNDKYVLSFFGVTIGMPEEEAYLKLSEKYPENMEGMDERLFVDFESKSSVYYTINEENVNSIKYMMLSNEMIEEYQSAKNAMSTDNATEAIPENPNDSNTVDDAIRGKMEDSVNSAADNFTNRLLGWAIGMSDDNVDKRNISMYFGRWYDSSIEKTIYISEGNDGNDYIIDLSSLGYGKNEKGTFTASQTIYMGDIGMGIGMNEDGSIYVEHISITGQKNVEGTFVKN